MLITSRTNSKVKLIRSLSSRKHRDREGLFFVEGHHLVAEAMETGAAIVMLVAALGPAGRQEAKGPALIEEHPDIPSLEVTPDVFGSISTQDGLAGVGAVVRQRWERLEQIRLAQETCWVAVDQIEHPGSLGTIVRTCDAVGGGGVILIGDSADPYDPTAVRASLGAVLWQRLVRTSFEQFAAWKREHGYPVVGTSPGASIDYQAVSYPTPVVVLAGNERVGLSPEQEAICDMTVRIPMVGRSPSHHVAVATGVVLYEIFNQRRAVEVSPRDRRAVTERR